MAIFNSYNTNRKVKSFYKYEYFKNITVSTSEISQMMIKDGIIFLVFKIFDCMIIKIYVNYFTLLI